MEWRHHRGDSPRADATDFVSHRPQARGKGTLWNVRTGCATAPDSVVPSAATAHARGQRTHKSTERTGSSQWVCRGGEYVAQGDVAGRVWSTAGAPGGPLFRCRVRGSEGCTKNFTRVNCLYRDRGLGNHRFPPLTLCRHLIRARKAGPRAEFRLNTPAPSPPRCEMRVRQGSERSPDGHQGWRDCPLVPGLSPSAQSLTAVALASLGHPTAGTVTA